MDEVNIVSMVRMGQYKDFPEYDIEDALCSGWVLAEDAQETDAPRKAKPRKA